jgi:hypothetical protein
MGEEQGNSGAEEHLQAVRVANSPSTEKSPLLVTVVSATG